MSVQNGGHPSISTPEGRRTWTLFERRSIIALRKLGLLQPVLKSSTYVKRRACWNTEAT